MMRHNPHDSYDSRCRLTTNAEQLTELRNSWPKGRGGSSPSFLITLLQKALKNLGFLSFSTDFDDFSYARSGNCVDHRGTKNVPFCTLLLVGLRGLEPPPLAGHDPKSCASASSATSPFRATQDCIILRFPASSAGASGNRPREERAPSHKR